MKKSVLLVLSFVAVCSLFAQEPPKCHHQPERTPEMIAGKQTELMVRELNITDSVQRQQLYDFHLKYARLRTDSTTRREQFNRMQAMNAELETILTPEQFNRFMDKQIEPSRHHPNPMFGPGPRHGGDMRPPRFEEGGKRLPPPEPRE